MNPLIRRQGYLILFLISLSLSASSQNIDAALLRDFNRHETTFKDRYLELNASSVTAVGVAVPATIAIAGFINHDAQMKRDALYLTASYVFNAVATQSIKKAFARTRPFKKYNFISERDDEAGGYSFPSGHTSAAFCTATGLALRYHRWYITLPAYMFAGSVGWARMYQGVHYPSDVLAGAALGSASAWLGWKVQKWMESKKEKGMRPQVKTF